MSEVDRVEQLARLVPQLVDRAQLIHGLWLHRYVRESPEQTRRLLASMKALGAQTSARRYRSGDEALERETIAHFRDLFAKFEDAMVWAGDLLAGIVSPSGFAFGGWRGSSACEVLARVCRSTRTVLDAGLVPERDSGPDSDVWAELITVTKCELAELLRRERLAVTNRRLRGFGGRDDLQGDEILAGEAMEIADVSRSTLQDWMSRGLKVNGTCEKLPHRKSQSGEIAISRGALSRFLVTTGRSPTRAHVR